MTDETTNIDTLLELQDVSLVYRALPDWVSGKLNRGAELDPRDEDPTYEQR